MDRELDAKIAQLMGHTLIRLKTGDIVESHHEASGGGSVSEMRAGKVVVHRFPAGYAWLTPYSTSIADAWLVFQFMCSQLFSVRRKFFRALQAQTVTSDGDLVTWPDVLVVLRDRLPEAICKAALEAK